MKNKYDENMSKSTALPGMNTTHKTIKLGSRARTPFCPQKSILAAKKSTFRLVFSKTNFAVIISLFETINWPKRKRYENFVSVAL